MFLSNYVQIFDMGRDVHHSAILLGSYATLLGHFAYVACSGVHVSGIWGHLGHQHLSNMLCFPKRRCQSKKTGHLGPLQVNFLVTIVIRLSMKQARLENSVPVSREGHFTLEGQSQKEFHFIVFLRLYRFSVAMSFLEEGVPVNAKTPFHT